MNNLLFWVGIATILVFVGTKMLTAHYYEISTQATLVVVISTLTASILLSL